ncbi:MAG: hypothetical protein ACE366_18680 [Bradymonadia bacterium]
MMRKLLCALMLVSSSAFAQEAATGENSSASEPDEITPSAPAIEPRPIDTNAVAPTTEPEPFDEVVPRMFGEDRAEVILTESVVRPDRWWLQGGAAVAIYDARREVALVRWSPGVLGGYRWTHVGVFGMLELDQTFDFTLETERLDVANIGVGIETLGFLGHVRSSFAVGASVLLSDTAIDEAGEVGWFIDMRPGGLRWALGEQTLLELTPIAFDVIVPVIEGLPLIVLSYTTVLTVEFNL